MDAELKAKWVKALRSGEYEQGHGRFENEGRHCCLGVLCVATGQPAETSLGCNWDYVVSVLGWNGISLRLACMNDRRKTFPEIADYIEANL